MNSKSSVELIEDIITCANITASAPASAGINNENIYINAYKELTSYLKHLFVYYDSKVKDDELKNILPTWGWSKYFDKINKNAEYEKVIIVSYNYDIWLERVLSLMTIDFNVSRFERKYSRKFQIIKPHGSISFAHQSKLDKLSFKIPYKKELIEISDGKATDFRVQYTDLNENYLINAIIPPAGDSGRYNLGWAINLRTLAKTEASNLKDGDEFIICGISYWHVDRAEIDEVLTSLTPNVNIKLLNPKPPRALNAVLSSLFNNYLCYSNSDILGE